MSTICRRSDQGRKGPVGAATSEYFSVHSVVLMAAKVAHCLPACCQLLVPSQCYCHRACISCCVFTHSGMEVPGMHSHWGLFGQSLLCLENKKPQNPLRAPQEHLSRTGGGNGELCHTKAVLQTYPFLYVPVPQACECLISDLVSYGKSGASDLYRL